MPQPAFPPTPAPSTDIKGREHGSFQAEQAFDLPPSAMSQRNSDASQKPYSEASVSPPAQRRPFDVSSPQKKRTASQAALTAREDHALPPPPTRSRKIIQVKPKNQEPAPSVPSASTSIPNAVANNGTSSKPQSSTANNNGNAKKGKQAAGTSAGRKIARKTAHSLIERRRRSKMNEEFGVLKDMIPACRGQEMHKLAILQASIDYLRYLENCLADVQPGTRPASSVASSSLPTRPQSTANTPVERIPDQMADSELDDDEDDDPARQTASSAQESPRQYRGEYYNSTFVSPALSATVTSPPFAAQSSSYPAHRQSGSAYDLPSPASARFPQDARYAPYQPTRTYVPSPHGQANPQSNQPSPMLLPQSSHSSAPSELDHEASAALLMLNASDRRSSISERKPSIPTIEPPVERSRQGMKGISVKDLLSN